nr:hypothetical protein [Stappia sp. MMSF_3263]
MKSVFCAVCNGQCLLEPRHRPHTLYLPVATAERLLSGNLYDWFHRAAIRRPVPARFYCAVEAGLGVAIADVVLAHQAIEDGRVMVPFRKAVSTGVSYFIVRWPALRRRRQVQIVESWVVDKIASAQRIIASYQE